MEEVRLLPVSNSIQSGRSAASSPFLNVCLLRVDRSRTRSATFCSSESPSIVVNRTPTSDKIMGQLRHPI